MLQDLELQSNAIIKTAENNQLLNSAKTTSTSKIETRNFGKCLVFLFWKGEPILTIGPHWYLFLCMFTTFFVSGVTIAFLVARYSSETSFYLMLSITALQNLTYLMTALKNPGICSSSQVLSEKALTSGEYCGICKIKMDRDIYHCQDCDICVRNFDHHCPWTGKCIGAGNILFFNTFITATMIFIITAILLSIHWI